MQNTGEFNLKLEDPVNVKRRSSKRTEKGKSQGNRRKRERKSGGSGHWASSGPIGLHLSFN